MPNLQLPIFPTGSVDLSPDVAVVCEGDQVSYFHGQLPVFRHRKADVKSFRLIASQLYLNGHVKQAKFVKVFGVTAISLKRAVATFEKEGAGGFWRPRKGRGAAVLTPEKVAQAQAALDQGLELSQVSQKVGINYSTLNKAIHKGTLHRPLKKTGAEPVPDELSTKSQRSHQDAQAPMGVGATDTSGRVLAALKGAGPAASHFELCADVPKAGVLLALPALICCGLLSRTSEQFKLPTGYYSLTHIFLVVAFMVLSRIKSVEGLRYCAPGEWGKIIGLDRIPEARTLRQKIDLLGDESQVAQWAALLCQDWMKEDPQSTGTLYVDGHVQVYHGSKAQLPRHYVPRERLCLRASTDYWVNSARGLPFFVVHRPVDPGLLSVLEEEIVPRLEKEVPNQPTAQQLEADPTLDKFILVFDREGYSPDFFKRMKERHIGCLTYHKHPGPDWPQNEFEDLTVNLIFGNQETMKLAERTTQLRNGLEMREIRQLEEGGHQTAIECTSKRLDKTVVASGMFARWSQENYLKYMRDNFALDHQPQNHVEALPETTKVVNPTWRDLERKRRSLAVRLNRKLVVYANLNLTETIEPEKVQDYLKKKTKAQNEATQLQQEMEGLKNKLKETDHHVSLSQLPEEQKCSRLSSGAKDLVDTIKMIAYRAETSMAQLLREYLPKGRVGEERRLLQSLYVSEADLLPDTKAGTLTVRLHYPANAMLGDAVEHLCADLNKTEITYPSTSLRLIYEMVSYHNPRDREL